MQILTIFFFQAEDGIRDGHVTGVQTLLFRSGSGQLWTSKCSITHKLQTGNEDADLTWMRALRSAPSGATIYGSLTPPPGLADANLPATISVRGPEVHEALLGSNRQYTFSGLSPGEYTVSALMAPGFVTADPRK